MRRVIIVSLLLHGLAGLALLAFLRWQPPEPPTEPARIEVLFGPGGPAPDGAPAAGRPATADPLAQAAGAPDAATAPDGVLATLALPPGPARAPPATSGGPAAAHAAGLAPGVRVDQPDPLTIPARDDPGNHSPEYPWEASRQHWQGRVLLRLHIDPDGSVSAVETLQSSGHAVLDAAATAALSRWHFLPARRDGQPIAWDRDQPIDFVIQQQGEP